MTDSRTWPKGLSLLAAPFGDSITESKPGFTTSISLATGYTSCSLGETGWLCAAFFEEAGASKASGLTAGFEAAFILITMRGTGGVLPGVFWRDFFW